MIQVAILLDERALRDAWRAYDGPLVFLAFRRKWAEGFVSDLWLGDDRVAEATLALDLPRAA